MWPPPPLACPDCGKNDEPIFLAARPGISSVTGKHMPYGCAACLSKGGLARGRRVPWPPLKTDPDVE